MDAISDSDLFEHFVNDVLDRFRLPYVISATAPVGVVLQSTTGDTSVYIYLGNWNNGPFAMSVLDQAFEKWYSTTLANPEADKWLGKILSDISHFGHVK